MTQPDLKDSFTTQEFHDSFNECLQMTLKFLWNGLEIIASQKIDGKNLIPDEKLEIMKKGYQDKTSFTLFRYHKLDNKANLGSEPHFDIGILTGIYTSSTPGLRVFDLQENDYIEIEKHFPINTFVILVGGKVNLTQIEKILVPTYHQVLTDGTKERDSIASMMDVYEKFEEKKD